MNDTLQAIPGVSARSENTVITLFPSIAADGIGRVLGMVMESIPIRIPLLWQVKVSYVLFWVPVAMLALPGYLLKKVFGQKYTISNRRVRIETAAPLLQGDRVVQDIDLADVEQVVIDQKSGQSFYHAADLSILNAKDDEIMRLAGVPNPEAARSTLLKTRDARRHTLNALQTIGGR